MWRLAALVLCACKQIYGLDDTNLPPPDAAYRCWEIGAEPFAFAEDIYQPFPQRCRDYHFTAGGAAVAMCDGAFASGRFDRTLAASGSARSELTSPQLTPDGMRVYLAFDDMVSVAPGTGASGISDFVMFERDGDAWIDHGVQKFLGPGQPSIFRGALGPRLIAYTTLGKLEEYELVGEVWEHRLSHPAANLGISAKASFAVTGDGLRAVYPGANEMMYTDRRDLESMFQRAVPLRGVPLVSRAQLTEDCGRVYYAGSSSVFFSQQQL